MWKDKIFTSKNNDGSITIHNFKSNWIVGSIIKNQFKNKHVWSLNKSDYGYLQPCKNHLFGIDKIRILSIKITKYTISDCETQEIPSLIGEVTVTAAQD